MTAAINSTGAGKRGYPTKSSVPQTQASTQRRARERSVAIQTLLLVRKSKSSSVKSKTAEARSEERFSRNAETDLVCRLLLEKKKKTIKIKKRYHYRRHIQKYTVHAKSTNKTTRCN